MHQHRDRLADPRAEILTVGLRTAPLAPPVLVPTAHPVRDGRAPRDHTWALASMIAAAILSTGAVTAAAIARSSHPVAPAQARHTSRPAPHVTTPPAPTTPALETPPAPLEHTAPAPALPARTVADPPALARPDRPDRPDRAASPARPAPAPRAPVATPHSAQPAAATSSSALADACRAQCAGDSMCLMSCAVRGQHRPIAPPSQTPHATRAAAAPLVRLAPPTTPTTPTTPTLATTPSREQVLTAMRAAQDEVRACVADRAGAVTVSATFASSGRITTVHVAGSFAGTPQGSCIARAVQREARVAPFAAASFAVTFPYNVR